jgi:hypothetical protein
MRTTAAGVLWMSDEEEEGWPSPGATEALLRGWRPRFCRPLLHHLMARRSMPLDQVRVRGVVHCGDAVWSRRGC